MDRAIEAINVDIASGRAKVMTADAVRRQLASGRGLQGDAVQVVTFGMRASLTGSAAMLLVPVAERGVFTRAEAIWLNDVPGHPGPAPNERLGVVDTLVFAQQPSRSRGRDYHGGHLIREILEGRRIAVECRSVEGDTYTSAFGLSELQFARLYCYDLPLAVSWPLTREWPAGLRPGQKMLLDGACAVIIGGGARCGRSGPSLSVAGEMFEMDPAALGDPDQGGTHQVALALPVLHEAGLAQIAALCTADAAATDQDPAAAEMLKDRILQGRFLLATSGEGPADEVEAAGGGDCP